MKVFILRSLDVTVKLIFIMQLLTVLKSTIFWMWCVEFYRNDRRFAGPETSDFRVLSQQLHEKTEKNHENLGITGDLADIRNEHPPSTLHN
jgi:hypothetical protein